MESYINILYALGHSLFLNKYSRPRLLRLKHFRILSQLTLGNFSPLSLSALLPVFTSLTLHCCPYFHRLLCIVARIFHRLLRIVACIFHRLLCSVARIFHRFLCTVARIFHRLLCSVARVFHRLP